MYVKVNNIFLFYQISGSGQPLILLHGNGENHHIFDKLVAKLQNHYSVYAIDTRNHGQSEKTADYSYESMMEDIYEFIKKFELNNIDLIGFSDGAIICLLLALKYPKVINKMALLGVNLNPSDFKLESYQEIKDNYEQTQDPLFKLMLEQPNIPLSDISNIKIPIFLIAGENDVFKPESFKKLNDALPDSKLKIMPGHTHESYIINQDILYQDLVDFF